MNIPVCRAKHQTFGKGMNDTPDLGDFGVPQTLGLLLVMAINICSGDRVGTQLAIGRSVSSTCICGCLFTRNV